MEMCRTVHTRGALAIALGLRPDNGVRQLVSMCG